MNDRKILSRHFLRRTARKSERRLQTAYRDRRIIVEKALRGPYRWYVVDRGEW